MRLDSLHVSCSHPPAWNWLNNEMLHSILHNLPFNQSCPATLAYMVQFVPVWGTCSYDWYDSCPLHISFIFLQWWKVHFKFLINISNNNNLLIIFLTEEFEPGMGKSFQTVKNEKLWKKWLCSLGCLRLSAHLWSFTLYRDNAAQ